MASESGSDSQDKSTCEGQTFFAVAEKPLLCIHAEIKANAQEENNGKQKY